MAKQTPKQREIVGRVMHEFKRGDLESSSGQEVKNPRQAIAIALHEAGASRDKTPAGNRRNPGRSRMTKAQLARAFGQRRAPSRTAPSAENLRGKQRKR